MRVVSWNIEWMNNWFVGGNQVAFRQSYQTHEVADSIPDVDNLARRVAQVIQELDPDILFVQEGPSATAEMELFVLHYLADENGQPPYTVFTGKRGSAQKVHILVRQGATITNPHYITDPQTAALIDDWDADVNAVGELAPYHFTREPLVVDCLWGNKPLRLINLHLKSKYIHDGERLWNNPEKRPQFIREALIARRRISAESMRVRRYLDLLLERDPLQMIIVAGDLNDGPGAEFFAQTYLTHNLTDVILGSSYHPALQFQHAFLHGVPGSERFTSRFDDFITGEQQKMLILDHLLVSPVLRAGRLVSEGLLYGRVAHAEFERAIDPNAPTQRQQFPSDHRPALAVFGP